MSTLALFTIITLFFLETRAFMFSRIRTDLTLDDNNDVRIRLNFNITMMDLRCDFAVVDVVSVLGTDQNVTTHITKWNVDAEGVRQRFKGRNRQQNDIVLYDDSVKESIEDLHQDGVDAISLTPDTLDVTIKENEYVFVDFFASWCSHCRDLAPTWETLAEVMLATTRNYYENRRHKYTQEDIDHALKVERPVVIAKVDCVEHQQLCMDSDIRAYPTLRLFVDGKQYEKGDYYGHRTIVEFTDWLTAVEEEHKKDSGYEKWVHLTKDLANERLNFMDDEDRAAHDRLTFMRERQRGQWQDDEHPGCQLAGYLLLDRVPGNFHILARSKSHDLVPQMTNVSHEIHHLSIGEPLVHRMISSQSVFVPDNVKDKLKPMDGNVYVTEGLHEAYHHYLKVITTNVDGLGNGNKGMKAYQILQNSQLAYYRSDVIPGKESLIVISERMIAYLTMV